MRPDPEPVEWDEDTTGFEDVISEEDEQEDLPKLPPMELAQTDAEKDRLRRLRLKEGVYATLPENFVPPVWDPKNDPNFEVDEIVVLFGARRTGKTTLAQEVLLKRKRLYPTVFCFSATAHNGTWQQVLPAPFVVNGIHTDVIHDIIQLNDCRVRAYCEKRQGNPMALIILEDPMADKANVRNATEIATVIYNGRHHATPMWVLSQDFVILQPGERTSVDRFILFASSDPRMYELIATSWGTRVLQMYIDVTREKDWVLVIDNKARTPVEQRIMKYKADKEWLDSALRHNRKLGNERMWDGIDIVEQKKQWPVLKLPPSYILESQFNKSVDAAETSVKPDPVDTLNLEALGGSSAAPLQRKEDPMDTEEGGTLFSGEPSCALL